MGGRERRERLVGRLREKEHEIASLEESLARAESSLDEIEQRYQAEKEATLKKLTLDRY